MTAIVKTFERPRCLARLLRSIARRYPGLTVLVADDSRAPYAERVAARYPALRTRVFIMPFDSGVSAGRNLLLREVATPYFVHCDDDFVFDRRTDLDAAVHLLEAHDLDILGGLCYDVAPVGLPALAADLLRLRLYRLRQRWTMQGVPRRFMGNFRDRDDGTTAIEPVALTPPVTRCELVQNFFIARTRAVRERVGGWDERIKIGGDHEDFFHRASRAGLRIGHTEPFGVVHYPERPSRYARFRARASWMRPSRFGRWRGAADAPAPGADPAGPRGGDDA
ncbi:glycosyltransferase family 2 protein [Inmirania thermothiophila]|uniref:glycosyltransferase family 2 protein n=1 Tax=Inmirania thermothiophila TaxID=1750597 RepID=UPI00147586EA|nr:glycosyltransferase [Inmirania thermothiophila]